MRVKPRPLVDDVHRWPVGQLPKASTTRFGERVLCTGVVHGFCAPTSGRVITPGEWLIMAWIV